MLNKFEVKIPISRLRSLLQSYEDQRGIFDREHALVTALRAFTSKESYLNSLDMETLCLLIPTIISHQSGSLPEDEQNSNNYRDLLEEISKLIGFDLLSKIENYFQNKDTKTIEVEALKHFCEEVNVERERKNKLHGRFLQTCDTLKSDLKKEKQKLENDLIMTEVQYKRICGTLDELKIKLKNAQYTAKNAEVYVGRETYTEYYGEISERDIYEKDRTARRQAKVECAELELDIREEEKKVYAYHSDEEINQLKSFISKSKEKLTTIKEILKLTILNYDYYAPEKRGDYKTYATNLNNRLNPVLKAVKAIFPDFKDDSFSVAYDENDKTSHQISEELPNSSYKTSSENGKSNNQIILSFIDTQLTRLGNHNEKYWLLLRFKHQILRSPENALSEKSINDVKLILSQHRDTGVVGFFKLTWLRTPKSLQEFTSIESQLIPKV